MFVTILGIGLALTILAFAIDAILWSFVFNKGMDVFTSYTPEAARAAMVNMMAKQFVNTVLFGLTFTFLYTLAKGSLPAGLLGGLAFGFLTWLATTAPLGIANNIFFDKVRPLSNANTWTTLIKFTLCGLLAGLLF